MDLSRAKQLLKTEGYTCVLCRDGELLTSRARGVAPILDWMDAGVSLKGFSAADKVVGKGAALLYIDCEVKELYSCVLSESAHRVLEEYRLSHTWDRMVPEIRNRTDTGPCPMEEAVKDIRDPRMAPGVLRKRLRELRIQENGTGQ